MRMPEGLERAIDVIVGGTPSASLVRACAALTDGYRRGLSPAITSPLHHHAYLAVRMPATYAAIQFALEDSARLIGNSGVSIRSCLDLGAGPGTASWAVVDTFVDIDRITLVERDSEWMSLGKRLAADSPDNSLRSAIWRAGDVSRLGIYEPHDLVVAAYVVAELEDRGAGRLVEAGFEAANELFVVVEPGTPAGFERVRLARANLIAMGGHVVAPCPHDGECPMSGADWCHFPVRLGRTSLHRRMKRGTLSFEDERFAFVVVSKRPIVPASSRIVRHPLRRQGHTYLDVCGGKGLERIVVAKHDRGSFRLARKAGWGDPWPGTGSGS